MNILLFGATGMVGDGVLRWLIASARDGGARKRGHYGSEERASIAVSRWPNCGRGGSVMYAGAF